MDVIKAVYDSIVLASDAVVKCTTKFDTVAMVFDGRVMAFVSNELKLDARIFILKH
jgi:hypothetical protein